MNGYWIPVMAPSPMKTEMGTYNLCRMVPAGLCLGKSEMSHDKAITICWEALETDVAGKRVAPHLYPFRRLWLLQGPAANGSSVAPLAAVKTELCCNEYKGGSLWKLLNAYRPCNSCWLWLPDWLPDVATQGLPKSLSGVCSNKNTD